MKTRILAILLSAAVSPAFGQVPAITSTEIGQIVQIQTRGCHCQGSGGHDCDATGVYTAPYGFSVVSVKELSRANTRGTFTERVKDFETVNFRNLCTVGSV